MLTNAVMLARRGTGSFTSVFSSSYSSERTNPRPGQPLYLHLSDLELGLRRFESDQVVKLLDYGCGASPYRNLFPNAEFRRADATDADDLDYRVGDDQSISERSEFFDVILSTQVLEHVCEPSLYLAECRRLLRPGGRLIISTHGMYEEHGVPHDFRRWTGHGLKAELEEAGFDVLECYRLTTHGRALAFLFEQHGASLAESRRHVLGFAFWCLNSVIRKYSKWFHRWCDSRFAASRVVDSSVPGQTLALGLLCLCVKRAR